MISTFEEIVRLVNNLRRREGKKPLTLRQIEMVKEHYEIHSRGGHVSVL